MSRYLVVGVVLVTMLLAMGVAGAQDGSSWYDKISVSGYFQARYATSEQESVNDSFEFRQMYLGFAGKMTDRMNGMVMLSRVGPGDPNVDLYLAFVDYKISDNWAVQFGQVPTWFGLEAWEGSSVRLPWERALILEGNGVNPGFYWQGAADRGIWVRREPTGSEPMVVVGACNGNFRASDNNDDKTLSVDVKLKRDWGLVGASWMDGDFTTAPAAPAQPVTSERSAWDAYIRVFPQPWGLQAEYADGKLMGADRDGYYVMGMYAFEDHPGTIYARWQEANVNWAPVNGASFSALPLGEFTGYEATTLGYQYRVDDYNNITVEWTDAEATYGSSSGMDCSYGGVQWQYWFK